MDYKFVSPLNSYVDALTPSAMVFGSGAFVRHLGSDEVMGVEPPWWNWCPYKGIKGPELSLFPPCKDTTGSQLSATTEPNHVGTLIMGFRPPDWEK